MTIPALAREYDATLRISVDPRQRFQSIDGFGVNVIGPWFRDDQKPMFDMLIDDLGATMFRVGPYFVYSNWEEMNDNDDPNLMNWEYYNNRYSSPVFQPSWALMRYLNSRGIRPLIALYGPVPDWMTDDKVGPLQQPTSLASLNAKRQNHLSPSMYDEFAEEVVSMLVYARTQARVDFEYFSPFNETDAYPNEGPRIDPNEVAKVLEVVARRLKKEGLRDVRLAPADQAEPTKDFISPILKDAEVMKQVGALTLHIYRDSDMVTPHVEHIRKSEFPHIPLWVTEYGELDDLNRTAENEWTGFSVAADRRALRALNQGAGALLIWDAFDDYEDCVKRLCYYGLFHSAGHVYSPKKRYYAAKQLYHFVRPGSQRIAAESNSPNLTVSAFRNGGPNEVIVVGVKKGGPGHVRVEVPGNQPLPATWDLYETTRQLDCVKVDTPAITSGAAEFDLPNEAIFTLVGKVKEQP